MVSADWARARKIVATGRPQWSNKIARADHKCVILAMI
jgi:hypothetical protein